MKIILSPGITIERVGFGAFSVCRDPSERFKECCDDSGIELRTSTFLNFVFGFRDGHCRPIRSVGCHGIKCIGNGYDSGSQWYADASYNLMKSAAVIMIVVCPIISAILTLTTDFTIWAPTLA